MAWPLLSCDEARSTALRPHVVARVDHQLVTAADLRERFHRGPADVRLRAMRKGGRHFLLSLVIDELLLEREARRRGLSPRFVDIHDAHKPLMQRLLAAELEPTFTPNDVTEAELRAEYERVRDQLSEPPRRKVHVVATKTAERARELIATIGPAMARNDEPEVHRLLSVEEPTSLASQAGLFDREAAETYLGPAAADAAFALDSQGVFPEPVRYGEDWSVVVTRLLVPPSPPPSFEQVEPQLRQRVYDRVRDQRLDSFVEGFLEHHRVIFNSDAAMLIPWRAPEVGAPQALDSGEGDASL